MKKGFTLIELLVVVLIIGILSAVALPEYRYAVEKSRATEAFVNGRHLAEAEELYWLANGSYTNKWDELGEEKPPTKTYSYTLDSTTYNILIVHQKIPGLHFRFFMQNVSSPYPGRYLCVAEGSSEIGARICKTLGKDPTKYVHMGGDYTAYFLN